jgi:hypothetical protein
MSVPEYRPDGDYEGEDSIPRPDENRDPLTRSDAQSCAFRSILELSMHASQGDGGALEDLKSLAELLCGLLGSDALRSELAEDVWQKLVRRSHAWPVVLPAEVKSRERALEILVQMPLGEKVGWKITKEHKRGRSVDWSEGSQARVALSLVWCIEGVRDTIKTYNMKAFELLRVNRELLSTQRLYARLDPNSKDAAKVAGKISELENRAYEFSLKKRAVDHSIPTNKTWAEFYELSGELVGKIRELPDFSKEAVGTWTEVAVDAVESGSWRVTPSVPGEWEDKARLQGSGVKGTIARKLRSGFKIIAPMSSVSH